MPNPADLAQLFRAKSGRLLAALIAQCQDLQLAEDALQDACMHAHESWQDSSVPDNPEAWLLTVARRRLIDRLRQSGKLKDESVLDQIASSLNPEQRQSESDHPIPDERLKLIFTCCHPALKQETQVALTLKTLCGLTTREIARAYLISEAAMSQRLVRAKSKIRQAGIAYKVPDETALDQRLEPVLATIYLIYNESYSAFEGQTLTRQELAEEAIRLARVLHSLLPRPDVAGLLSLMLLHQARSSARSSKQRCFIPLQEQDRSLWDQQKISEGRRILLSALSEGRPEKYQLQASISAIHTEAHSWEQTDWKQILLLYLTLYEKDPSPVVKLNGLVALAQSGREVEALSQLQSLADELAHYQPYHAAKAEMEARLDHSAAAEISYKKAISLTKNEAERSFLIRRLEQLMM